jgi:hypothetical protein
MNSEKKNLFVRMSLQATEYSCEAESFAEPELLFL